jgi:hypothetical protein
MERLVPALPVAVALHSDALRIVDAFEVTRRKSN